MLSWGDEGESGVSTSPLQSASNLREQIASVCTFNLSAWARLLGRPFSAHLVDHGIRYE
jgi:hypothetical protein